MSSLVTRADVALKGCYLYHGCFRTPNTKDIIDLLLLLVDGVMTVPGNENYAVELLQKDGIPVWLRTGIGADCWVVKARRIFQLTNDKRV